MHAKTLLFTALVATSTLLVVACGSSGREMREPTPGATAPPRRAPTAGTIGPSTTLATVFAITTDAWSPGGTIPVRYTCDGDRISPPLVISQIPAGTVELAVTVTDPDNDDYAHWILAGVDPTTTAIEEGTVPAGAVQAQGDGGIAGYQGPCPPVGSSHLYEFTVFALATPSGVADNQDAATALAQIRATAETAPPGVMTGTYER